MEANEASTLVARAMVLLDEYKEINLFGDQIEKVGEARDLLEKALEKLV